MADKSDTKKKQMIEALHKCKGIVSNAADMCGIHRSTHYEWLASDEEYKTMVDDAKESAIDYVENKLFELIDGVTLGKVDSEGELKIYDQPPCKTSVIFYLKTQGKKRGYQESSRIDLNQTKGDLPDWFNE
jgi:hypothetical protein